MEETNQGSEKTYNFGDVLKHLKEKPSVNFAARTGWNGKGMYIMLQVPDENSKMSLPYIYMSTVDGKLVPWLASQTDMLAEDYVFTKALMKNFKILAKNGKGDGMLPMKESGEREKKKSDKQKMEEFCNFLKNAFVVDGDVFCVKSKESFKENAWFLLKDSKRGKFAVAFKQL